MSTWVTSSSWLFGIMLLWTWVPLSRHCFQFLGYIPEWNCWRYMHFLYACYTSIKIEFKKILMSGFHLGGVLMKWPGASGFCKPPRGILAYSQCWEPLTREIDLVHFCTQLAEGCRSRHQGCCIHSACQPLLCLQSFNLESLPSHRNWTRMVCQPILVPSINCR